jgi:hypothetical protein
MMYSALRDLLTLASCLLTPVAGRKQPAGVEAFGKATSGFLLFWAAMVVGRGQLAGGSTGCQKKGKCNKSVLAQKNKSHP